MCGIAGYIDFHQHVTREQVQSLCDRLTTRGPDAFGYYAHQGVGLGHRRLSIIDLETGDQPMFSADSKTVIVFNGEIYNFQELRQELLLAGAEFKTNSDTEVILEGYKRYGIDGILNRLEGMFAFVLYDIERGISFIARDKFGEKPLYYLHDDDKLVVASELKAIAPLIPQKEICQDGLNLFLSLSYIPAPFTIYKQIAKLMPGHYMEVQHGKVVTNKYYDLLDRIRNKQRISDFNTAKQQLHNLLSDSVKKRMVSDVPLGAFLSGGIDSSIVTALMAKQSDKPVKTFSIGFVEKEYDESERAQLLADHIGAEHVVHFLDYQDVVQLIDPIIAHFDEPFGDSSAIPSYFVASLARKDVTVVLTGDCADELFGGYEKYLATYYAKRFNQFPKPVQWIARKMVNLIPHIRMTNGLLRRVKKVMENANTSGFEAHYRYMCLGFNDAERHQLLQNNWFANTRDHIENQYKSYESGSEMEKGFYTDLRLVLEGDMLVKVDRMCMKSSLEARVPFLDSRIVEAAYLMPEHFKIKGKDKKHILKKTFGYLLPEATLNYKKQGFGVPVDYWFNNQLADQLNQLLEPNFLISQGIFHSDAVQKLLNEHRTGRANHKGKLWNLFVFQKWYQVNF
jgi:asparagine synthase (glutamine-hydrolysing)